MRKDDVQVQIVLLMFCIKRYVGKKKKKKKTGIENYMVMGRPTLKLGLIQIKAKA